MKSGTGMQLGMKSGTGKLEQETLKDSSGTQSQRLEQFDHIPLF